MQNNHLAVQSSVPAAIGQKSLEKVSIDPKEVAQAKSLIDLDNPLSIQKFDEQVSNKLVDFNTRMLSKAKVTELGDSGTLIMLVVLKAKGLDPSQINAKPGLLGRVLGRAKSNLVKFTAQFESVEQQIDAIADQLKRHSAGLTTEVASMRELFFLNYEQFRDYEVLLAAARERMNEVNTIDLPAARQEAEAGDAAAVQNLAKLQGAAHRLGKKIDRMDSLRTDCLLTAQELVLTESVALNQIESIDDTVVVTIQQWKKVFSRTLALEKMRRAAEINGAVQDMNNDLRKKSAELLSVVATDAARQSERGTYDIETLEAVHKGLITTLDTVAKIQSDGRAKQVEDSKRREALEISMKERLLAQRTT